MHDADLIIAGAGPVGMLAAILAADSGMSVIVYERERFRPRTSRAIGITPPSLEIMKCAGIDKELIRHGVPVRKAEAYGRRLLLGRVDLSHAHHEYPFVLAIPQHVTESVLESALLSRTNIRFVRGSGIVSAGTAPHGVHTLAENGERYTAEYLFACDGVRSTIRQSLGIRYIGDNYKETFLMGDFEDTTDWGDEARFFFTPRGCVESFPLPGSIRRYVLRTPSLLRAYETDYLEREIPVRCGVDVRNARKVWESGFSVHRYEAERFREGNIFLCGDAAHCISPIGGQGMNTGFADAELAVWIANRERNNGLAPEHGADIYRRFRLRAVRAAARRAEILMTLGTSGGRIRSFLRNIVAIVLLRSPIVRLLVPVFTMISIPKKNCASAMNELVRESTT